jgi:hypothetical protein
MPTDWKSLEKEIDSIIDESAKKTDIDLASKMSTVSRLTEEEIKKLFPKPSEVKDLFDLMKIVKSAESRNTKINKIMENSERFAGIVLTLLTKLA